MSKLPLGPKGFTGIAIIGSAPSSMGLAPYTNDKWAIWCVSPAVYPQAPRSDVWFEVHRFFPAHPGGGSKAGTVPWFSPEFTAFLNQYKGPVFMSQVVPEIPNSIRYPFEDAIARYGPYHFNSSISWMLSMAIDTILAKRESGEIGKTEGSIGLWGVDMAATEEYAYQRPGCQHFLGMAMGLGIQVVLPPESDLMRPPLMYGLGEQNPRHIKLLARMREWDGQIAQATNMITQAQAQLQYLKGAKDATEYLIQSWSDDVTPNLAQAVSMASEYVPRETLPIELTPEIPVGVKGNGKDHAAASP